MQPASSRLMWRARAVCLTMSLAVEVTVPSVYPVKPSGGARSDGGRRRGRRWRPLRELPPSVMSSPSNQIGWIMSSAPVDHPDRKTVQVRQGTGPRSMVSVLLISMALAVLVGLLLLAYFYAWPLQSPQRFLAK